MGLNVCKMLFFFLFALASAKISTKDAKRIKSMRPFVGPNLVYGMETSGSRLFVSFHLTNKVRHQNFLNKKDYFVSKGTRYLSRNFLLKNKTHAYSADEEGILSVTLDPATKTSTSKRICHFPNGKQFSDMTLSKGGIVYYSTINTIVQGNPQGVTGSIYKCTENNHMPILTKYNGQIISLKLDQSDIYFLTAHYDNKQFQNSSMAKISLNKRKRQMGVQVIYSEKYLPGQKPYNLIIRKHKDHFYIVLSDFKKVMKITPAGVVKKTYPTDLYIERIALFKDKGVDKLVIYGRKPSYVLPIFEVVTL